MKKTLALLLLVPLLLSGCHDYVDTEELALVAGGAIDLNDRPTQEKPGTLHLISEQVVSDENGAQKGRLISSYGYALDQAQANADRIAGISLYWNHAKVFLVGEPLAKQGLNELMGSVLADPRVRMSSFLMVAKGGDAGALFEKDADGVQFFQLQEKIDSAYQSRHTHRIALVKFLNDSLEEGISRCCPRWSPGTARRP
ncbi:MAG: hypothetical protein PHD32_07035 [Eubacteriales bacterium]|nr:hypothetical protein [Eubacteriales bacterium]